MNNISEYMNENVADLVFELKGETYLNAAKKAKKLGDPRSIKFLQAYKDNIDKEFMSAEGPDKENDRFLTYYNADKKAIQRLKGLADGEYKANVQETAMGTYLDINNSKNKFYASIFVEYNKNLDREVFLRQSLIEQGKWELLKNKFAKLADKINSIKAMKPFTYVRIIAEEGTFGYWYLIDDDEMIPTVLRTDKANYKDDECLDNLPDTIKNSANILCKAMNQNHKDI